ncbi:MAG TPA: hypothetical protein ENL35_03650, partial [Chloroflexi bacterium]|nr:hypothetical protein [Chloroflexota bacterium]
MRSALRRIASLAIKEFIHLRRDWWLPAFMLLGGAIELVLVGWATSRPMTNLPLMVLDGARISSSAKDPRKGTPKTMFTMPSISRKSV